MTSQRMRGACVAVLGLAAAATLTALAATPANAAVNTVASRSGNILFFTAASGGQRHHRAPDQQRSVLRRSGPGRKVGRHGLPAERRTSGLMLGDRDQ